MTHLQPNLGETRCQQLRSSPCSPSSLCHSPMLDEGEEFRLKKGTIENTQNHPFCGHHHNKKEAPKGNVHMGDNPPQAVINQ